MFLAAARRQMRMVAARKTRRHIHNIARVPTFWAVRIERVDCPDVPEATSVAPNEDSTTRMIGMSGKSSGTSASIQTFPVVRTYPTNPASPMIVNTTP
ncbi:hypothetical protein BMIN_1500 [Bifidobacterium minimum]|uniref:Uncharacterized protein n=1 Tax=Bifidobacterium minimum TaxID=1693 RepID=A0A087BLD4_9BIFI|nr:hypothetical protein BMIN_1500 [Bifidobacterium minimum]